MIEDVMNDLANEMQLRIRDNEEPDYDEEIDNEEEYDGYLEQCNDDDKAEQHFE